MTLDLDEDPPEEIAESARNDAPLVARAKQLEARAKQKALSIGVQLELFCANAPEVSWRNDFDSMDAPIYAVDARENHRVWVWCSEDGKRSITVTPGPFGRVTMNDKLLTIFMLSQLTAYVDSGKPFPRFLQFQFCDFFKAIDRRYNKRSEEGKKRLHKSRSGALQKASADSYDLQLRSLERLKSNHIVYQQTMPDGTRVARTISLVGDWVLVDCPGRPMTAKVEITEWMREVVERRLLLHMPPEYFTLPPMERRLYEIGAKHLGTKHQFRIRESTLYKKMGTYAKMTEFRRTMKQILRRDRLPRIRFKLAEEPAKDGSPMYIVYPRDTNTVASRHLNSDDES